MEGLANFAVGFLMGAAMFGVRVWAMSLLIIVLFVGIADRIFKGEWLMALFYLTGALLWVYHSFITLSRRAVSSDG